MNKRNTEGFALAYVVVVITVLCTLSIGLMSISLRVLQVQEKNMQRMQDKYEAQGAVELLIAELTTSSTDGLLSIESVVDKDFSDTSVEAQTKGISAVVTYFNGSKDPVTNLPVPAPVLTLLNRNTLLGDSVEDIQIDYDEEEEKYLLSSCVHSGDYSIDVAFELSITIDTIDDPVENTAYKPDADDAYKAAHPSWNQQYISVYSYKVSDVSFEFVSYAVNPEEGGRT